jgi:hypothetical protein
MTTPGLGLAIMVNANAKRGHRRIAVELQRRLPGAIVRLTRKASETDAWLQSLPAGRCVLAAGGDGTAIGLVGSMDRVRPADERLLPPMGVLPLGTGNAWAHVTGARKLNWCVERLARHHGPLPMRHFGLVEVEGVLTHFAGSGWDSEILEDYKAQLQAAKGPSAHAAKSVWGYLSAVFLRTVPKNFLYGRPNVLVETLDDEVYVMAKDGSVQRMDAKPGTVLYDGPASVAGAATCPEFGYRFRAYPFAERMLGLINIRVYDQHVVQAVPRIPMLWTGAHPMKGMNDWFVKHVRMTFSRPVPLQVGGDACGMRRTIEYKASSRLVQLLEWRRMR